ncbi:hypothetical protein AAII07_08935 [Microvirga sp. 0TCS3.31]
MTDGVERARLRTYLTGAQAETSDLAGENWRKCGNILAETAEALRKGAAQIRDGEGDGQDGGLSGMMADALLAAFEDSSSSMEEKGTRLVGGGDALKDAARVMSNAKTAEAGMADLQQPPAYTAPTPLPGVPPTPKEIQAEATKRQAANQEMAAYNTARAQQEAAAAQWTQKLDAVFLGSIPPMQAIHGQPDPTEPPPSVPGGPSGPSLPPTGPRTPGTPDPTNPQDPDKPGQKDPDKPEKPEPTKPDPTKPEPTKPEPTRPEPTRPEPTRPEPTRPEPVDPQPPRNPTTSPTYPTHQVPGETSTIGGSSQSGVTYNPSAGQAPSGPATGGSAGGMNAAAMGAAGAAGGASGMAGGIRAGATPAPAGSSPARPIGATGRSASAGALSRPAGASGSAAARAGTAGSPTSRGAGSAGARGAGSAGGRGAGSAGARGAGSAGGRGAGSAGGRGSATGTGSRSGGRGSTGARGAAGGASGRGGRKGEDDQAAERDSLVYEQDWLGDDDVAPGVLD